jgi:arsenite methyltransferase
VSAGATTSLADLLESGDVKGCCAAAYANPAVRWLLDDELHPGGGATTRRALELAGVDRGERLLDVACGSGSSALLAARELSCEVVGVDYGESAVAEARLAAEAEGLSGRVTFAVGDAETLPFGDGEFDVVLCECSLCTFADKRRAVAEIRRVLARGGRLALSDVVADHDRLPGELRGVMATVACVGEALDERGYRELLAAAGFEVTAFESRDADAARLAERVHDRLRGARLIAGEQLAALPGGAEGAIALAATARDAIAAAALGYVIIAAE